MAPTVRECKDSVCASANRGMFPGPSLTWFLFLLRKGKNQIHHNQLSTTLRAISIKAHSDESGKSELSSLKAEERISLLCHVLPSGVLAPKGAYCMSGWLSKGGTKGTRLPPGPLIARLLMTHLDSLGKTGRCYSL